jgi:hypothetical protein
MPFWRGTWDSGPRSERAVSEKEKESKAWAQGNRPVPVGWWGRDTFDIKSDFIYLLVVLGI